MAEITIAPLSLFQCNPFMSKAEQQEWARYLNITWEDFENRWTYHTIRGKHGEAARAARSEVDALPEYQKQEAITAYIKKWGYKGPGDVKAMGGLQAFSAALSKAREAVKVGMGRGSAASRTSHTHTTQSGAFIPSEPSPGEIDPRTLQSYQSFRGSAAMRYAMFYPAKYRAHRYAEEQYDKSVRKMRQKTERSLVYVVISSIIAYRCEMGY
ncbi:hypothetical protein HYFRA_00010636 [Hymenoscyphus fraxineus]|uniref:Uncharacterized protein n=1 Tax=Hymenoscyphus fraxineus TaxID=746836 RepID=A0A9N9PZW8_9HELO|nr:hypothetical protein HYFRA_00010636 [Hymenoscyphus fraxineus]